jgi:hypothetical protein
MEDLSGLENLTQIGGDLWINQNDSLASLTGLDELTTIGGGLLIGYDYGGGDRSGMSSLASLSALNNLTSIGGILCVRGTAVTSLNGLENIDAGSIGYLYLESNSLLSTCEVNSICDYLAMPDADVWISGNAHGCDSQEEVEAACVVGVEEPAVGGQRSAVSSYPNPTSGIVDFQISFFDVKSSMYNTQRAILKVYNAQGQEVATVLDAEMAAGEHTVSWDATALPAGIYYYRLTILRTASSGPAANCQLPTVSGKIVKY